MIRYINDDIRHAPHALIVHGVDKFGKMTFGGSKDLKHTFPGLQEIFRSVLLSVDMDTIDPIKYGDVVWAQVVSSQTVANCVCQNSNKLDLEGLKACFYAVNRRAKKESIKEIALCPFGQIKDWNSFSKILEEEITDVDVVIYVKDIESLADILEKEKNNLT